MVSMWRERRVWGVDEDRVSLVANEVFCGVVKFSRWMSRQQLRASVIKRKLFSSTHNNRRVAVRVLLEIAH